MALDEDQRKAMMYTGISMDFNTERNLAWSRSQMLTIISVAGVSIVTTAIAIELRYIIIFFGFGLVAGWYQANRRTQRRIKHWQDCLARMEPLESEIGVFRVFTGADWKDVSKPPLLYAINALPLLFLVIWFVALSFTLREGGVL